MGVEFALAAVELLRLLHRRHLACLSVVFDLSEEVLACGDVDAGGFELRRLCGEEGVPGGESFHVFLELAATGLEKGLWGLECAAGCWNGHYTKLFNKSELVLN